VGEVGRQGVSETLIAMDQEDASAHRGKPLPLHTKTEKRGGGNASGKGVGGKALFKTLQKEGRIMR